MNGPRIKVCGLTRVEDAERAVGLGAWALGFIFHRESPRAATCEQVAACLALAARPGLRTVGVFVNAGIEEIAACAGSCGINTIQLHGEEPPSFCAELRARLPDRGLIKALRPKDAAALKQLQGYAPHCEAILLDSHVAGVRGGSGQVGDWGLAAEAVRTHPGVALILAGGLTAANVGPALRSVPGVFALDVSSGMEDSPGKKSSAKMREFFAQASGAQA